MVVTSERMKVCGNDVRTGGRVWCVMMTSERVVVCGVWCVVCGVWCVVCGVW